MWQFFRNNASFMVVTILIFLLITTCSDKKNKTCHNSQENHCHCKVSFAKYPLLLNLQSRERTAFLPFLINHVYIKARMRRNFLILAEHVINIIYAIISVKTIQIACRSVLWFLLIK